jgi:hypothetical protein
MKFSGTGFIEKKRHVAMTNPGYYKLNYRALSFGGLMRMHGLLRAPLAYFITRFRKPTPMAWMPALWGEMECPKQDLSNRFWTATSRQRHSFADLGFTEVGFKKLKKILDPRHRDNGGINYLDTTRTYFGQLHYNKVHVPQPVQRDKERISVAFTAVFKHLILSHSNGKNPFEAMPQWKIVRHRLDDVGHIYRSFLTHVKSLSETPRRFDSDHALRLWFDSNQQEVFEDRLRRGIFIKMTNVEVEAVRHG